MRWQLVCASELRKLTSGTGTVHLRRLERCDGLRGSKEPRAWSEHGQSKRAWAWSEHGQAWPEHAQSTARAYSEHAQSTVRACSEPQRAERRGWQEATSPRRTHLLRVCGGRGGIVDFEGGTRHVGLAQLELTRRGRTALRNCRARRGGPDEKLARRWRMGRWSAQSISCGAGGRPRLVVQSHATVEHGGRWDGPRCAAPSQMRSSSPPRR